MSEADVRLLVHKRGQMKRQITCFKAYLTSSDNLNVQDVKVRLEKIEPLWGEFDELQTKLEIIAEGELDTVERAPFEENYFAVVSLAKQLIGNRTEIRNSTSSCSDSPTIKLPQLNLPVFTGALDQWLLFYDTFNSLIHLNPALSGVQKFQYLRSSLKNQAAEVIQSLEVSEANYVIAWDLLKERFENKRLIIHNHVKALFELNSINKESAVALRQLLDQISKHTRALTCLNEPVQHWDTLLIYLISSKLDNCSKREWEASIISNQSPGMGDLIKFLSNRCHLLETLDLNKQAFKPQTSVNKHNNYKYSERTTAHATIQAPTCEFCKASHTIYKCKDFIKLPITARIAEIQKLKLCDNCLRGNHSVEKCRGRPCMLCKKKHNTLIHVESNSTIDEPLATGSSLQENNSVVTHCSDRYDVTQTQVLLSTALVYVYSSTGAAHECRVLLDSGSQSNFITKGLSDLLNLKRDNMSLAVSGINKTTTTINFKTEARIKSKCSDYSARLTFLVLPKITNELPAISVNRSHFNIPENIKLADDEFNKSAKIDMLIGSTIFWDLLSVGQIKINKNRTILQKTQLGWIVSGPINYNINATSSCNLSIDDSLNESLKRFWQLEDCEDAPKFSEEEAECENHFVKNTTRNRDGRFIVTLPLRSGVPNLGDSEEMALKRLYAIERKLQRQPHLREDYLNFMREYEEMGHMTRVSQVQHQAYTNTYYLPHHSVIKPCSTSTRLLVVFNASAKTTNGLSLNDKLMVGPTIQEDIFSIILRFRTDRYVFTGDIAKMYRQIIVRPEDRHMQQILWRWSTNEPVVNYQLNTVTYGTASAPFLAVRCLQQVAQEFKAEFPVASNTILHDFYVDDLITGTNTLDEALSLKHDICSILKSAGFELRKFASNDNRIYDTNTSIFHITDDHEVKTLGLLWYTTTDTLLYNVKSTEANQAFTKRTILSATAQIFDPLGLLGPIIVIAKLTIQKLWQLQIGWDESLPLDLHTKWAHFQHQMNNITKIQIPRHVVCCNPIKLQLHGFSDASESAYGACIYLRSTNQAEDHVSYLLCAKSRVAPLKTVTLARLELCGALLLAQLVNKALSALRLKVTEIFYWCDSTITLSWIAGAPHKWKTFVANRVAKIQRLTDANSWHHVRSQENPADLLSRGIMPTELINNNLWWKGPTWLSCDSHLWPQSSVASMTNVPEQRSIQVFTNLCNDSFNIFNRYSTLTKLQNVVAYMLRFIKNASVCANSRTIGPLTVNELDASLTLLLRLAQSNEFSKEIASLRKNEHISKKSKLCCLNPFLDATGLIRVGGRLRNAEIAYNQKHPVVLASNHSLTKLLIRHEHEQLMHAGTQAVIASIRTKFWPLSTKNTVKGVLRTCIKCFKTKPNTIQPLMGDLPQTRLSPTRPFLRCGVDYAGPFFIKEKRFRNKNIIKAYLCLFVCFSTKAVHLELVEALTTDSFLNAMKRFISRRGKCQEIYSDNGTNFVGANNELKELYKFLSDENSFASINNFLSHESIQWHFIPPKAPNFGGLWEAAIKSAKIHLKRVVGDAALTYEEMYTVFTQVEACLNSRPITPISNDPNDLTPLTPGHFLIGDSLKAVPQADLQHLPPRTLTRYQRIQQLLQHFWTRWSKEYLGQLQQRIKWKQGASECVKEGSLVILKDDNLPPLKWQMGRIQRLHFGKDNTCRVVDVRTNSGVVKRALSKVCFLPIDN